MRYFALTCVFLFFILADSDAQQKDTVSASKEWTFSAAANLYILRDDFYVSPVFTADHNHLHLEGRYNYEDVRTGSAFIGYNFSIGKKFELNATPMLGTVFGRTNGIAPGLLLDVYYWKLNFYSESEYLFDFSGKESHYFYSWSDINLTLTKWMSAGIAIQRTKLYKTELELQKGFKLGFNWKYFSLDGYLFNLGWDDPFGVISVAYEF